MPTTKSPTQGSRVKFENRFLRVDVDLREIAIHVTERATGVQWRMAASTDQDVMLEDSLKVRTPRAFASSKDKQVSPARNGQIGTHIRMQDLGLGLHVYLDGRSLVVEIERIYGQGPARVRDVLFPRHFLLPKRNDSSTTWTVGQGSIVPGNSTSRFHHPEGYSEQEMCFHGAMNGQCGMVAIAETPFDLYMAMSHLDNEAPSTFIHWLPSHSDLRYTRRVRFTFEKGLNFVRQAKLYRAHMQREGFWVSLEEKVRQNPNVARMRGAAVINSLTAIRHVRELRYEVNTFADQTTWALELRKRTGLKNAIVHVDGWGKFGYDSVHPETLPPCPDAGGPGGLKDFREKMRDAGWLFGLHDQYIDIYADAPSYDPARFMIKENGRPNTLNVWAGGLCSHLCFSESLKFLRRNFADGVKDQYMYHNSPPIYKICEPDAYYLDCLCRIHECFNPNHPLTRSEVVHYANEMLRTVRDHGKRVVLSCEHPKFYSVPDLDFGWGISHLKADVQVVGGGHATESVGTPVPLWHLVFHDAIWLPLHGSNYLQNFLYVESPYFQNTKDGPPQTEIDIKMKVCRLNEVAGFDEMTGFEIQNGGTVMSSEFSSGVRVSVNHAEKTYRINGPRAVATQGNVKLK
jgi:hypothetical protein